MKRILFVASTITSFRRKDLDILHRHFSVDVVTGKLGLRGLVASIGKVARNQVVFCWFVTKRVFFFVLLSKLLRRKSVLVTGGNDIVEVPEIGYRLGMLNTLIAKLTLALSDRILAFSNSSRNSVLQLAPKARVETVYVGAIDTEKFKPSGEKTGLIITVGHVSWSNLERKGLRTFVKMSRLLSNRDFKLVGAWDDESVQVLKSMGGKNITFSGHLPLEELVECYQKASVYVQLSIHEGFGISVAEAMACECVPVVSEIAALPEVVGDTGYYACYDSPEAAAEAIEKALNDREKGKRARLRVEKLFTLKRRERELVKVVSEIM